MYKEPEFIDFKSNFSEYQLGLSALRKVSHFEESLQKYKTVLLGKVYDREKLSYGSAKNPLTIGEKKSPKKKLVEEDKNLLIEPTAKRL